MINLLPNDLKQSRLFGRRSRVLLSYIFALLIAALLIEVIMLVSIWFVGSNESFLNASIQNNQVQVTSLEGDIKDLSATVSRLGITEKLFDNSIKFSELIPQIGGILPQGAIINSLTLTGGNADPLALNVDLTTADLSSVLQRNLADSELFEAADIGAISPKGADGIYKYSATVTVSFTGSAEAKRKIAAAAAAATTAQKEAQKQNGGSQ